MKKALITGIAGQDGSYLAEFLLGKRYEVFGTVNRSTQYIFENIDHIQGQLNLFNADLLDRAAMEKVLKTIEPDEIYNLAAQSSPGLSFKQPILTVESNGVGAHKLIELVQEICPKAHIYQASSAEMFGWTSDVPQDEKTRFVPSNPYGAAKLYAHQIASIYRRTFGMFIACGIMYNHESPRRGLGFVTQKVAYAAACAKLGVKTSRHLNEEGEPIFKDGKVALGNLDSKRDWGFAGDYVEAMWLMLQAEKADDFIVATGKIRTVADLCQAAFGHVDLNWKDFIYVDKRFVRPVEVNPPVGDPSKAKLILKWQPEVDFEELIGKMVDNQLERLKKFV